MDDNLKEKEQHDELIKLYSKWESICDAQQEVFIVGIVSRNTYINILKNMV